jgi:hypothetical protein
MSGTGHDVSASAALRSLPTGRSGIRSTMLESAAKRRTAARRRLALLAVADAFAGLG